MFNYYKIHMNNEYIFSYFLYYKRILFLLDKTHIEFLVFFENKSYIEIQFNYIFQYNTNAPIIYIFYTLLVNYLYYHIINYKPDI